MSETMAARVIKAMQDIRPKEMGWFITKMEAAGQALTPRLCTQICVRSGPTKVVELERMLYFVLRKKLQPQSKLIKMAFDAYAADSGFDSRSYSAQRQLDPPS